MIRYDRLWKTMKEKGITQYRLIRQHNFSAGQIGRLKKNMHVSTHTIETLCGILQCGIGDIIEFWPDDVPWPSEEPAKAVVRDIPLKADKPKTKKAAAKTSKTSAEEPEKPSQKPEKDTSKKAGKGKAEKPAKEKSPKPEKEKKAGKGKKDKSEKKNKDGKKK